MKENIRNHIIRGKKMVLKIHIQNVMKQNNMVQTCQQKGRQQMAKQELKWMPPGRTRERLRVNGRRESIIHREK
jgi:hypothetical protein